MDSLGYFGEVSYRGQNRFRPYYAGTAGLGSIPAIPSGGYRGAPGRLVQPREVRSRDLDMALFGGLGITVAGVGLGLTDRERCQAGMSVGGSLARVATAAAGPRPTRRVGESADSYNRRVSEWEIATRVSSTSGEVFAAGSTVCNLIEESSNTASSSSGSSNNDWAAMRNQYYGQPPPQQQAGGGVSTQTLMLIGGGLLVAGAAYFLFLK